MGTYTINIYQRGGDLVFYRGVVGGEPLNFTRVIGRKKVVMTNSGDYIDVIYFDADNEYAIDSLGKGHYSYDEAMSNSDGNIVEEA